MKNQFEVPAKPWGDKEIKFLMANQPLLDNETKAELGLTVSEEVVEETPVETPSEGSEEVETPETGQEDEETVEESTPESDVQVEETVNTETEQTA
jgi:uncharacterized membrane protein